LDEQKQLVVGVMVSRTCSDAKSKNQPFFKQTCCGYRDLGMLDLGGQPLLEERGTFEDLLPYF